MQWPGGNEVLNQAYLCCTSKAILGNCISKQDKMHWICQMHSEILYYNNSRLYSRAITMKSCQGKWYIQYYIRYGEDIKLSILFELIMYKRERERVLLEYHCIYVAYPCILNQGQSFTFAMCYLQHGGRNVCTRNYA